MMEYVEIWKLTLKLQRRKSSWIERKRRRLSMMRIRGYPTLLLAFMGSMDCLTTVIGVLYFGAIESNPLIAGVASYSLPAFVVLKMTATLFSCLIFVQAEKILMQSKDKSNSSISRTQTFLKVARGAVVAFLFVVVANNVLVLASAF